MGLFSNIFGGKQEEEKPITSYADFWNWFGQQAQGFAEVIKANGNIEKKVFDVIRPKLHQLDDNIFYLVGLSEGVVELVLTVDGKFKSIAAVEELVAAAPAIPGWKFTALKPAMGSGVGIGISGFEFNSSKLHFYANEHADYPDEIDITIVHDDYRDEEGKAMAQGVYLYLDNYLGELQFVSTIDNMRVTGKEGAEKELISIDKLEEYLGWREKEFVEKYEGTRRNTEDDQYSLMEGRLENGNPLVATVNADVLKWERKASHPWIMTVIISYKGNAQGMPDEATLAMMEEIQNAIQAELQDADGYINIGRQTADGARELYYACKDFRKPSKVLRSIEKQYAGRADISFDIYKDKYWQSFERFGGV
jgi:hypothetical protein